MSYFYYIIVFIYFLISNIVTLSVELIFKNKIAYILHNIVALQQFFFKFLWEFLKEINLIQHVKVFWFGKGIYQFKSKNNWTSISFQ